MVPQRKEVNEMAQHTLRIGDNLKIGNIIFRVRKINKKDIIIREVKPPVTVQAKKQAKEKQASDEKKVEDAQYEVVDEEKNKK